MPSYGEKQMPAGVVRNIAKPILGSRTMRSKDGTIMPAITRPNTPNLSLIHISEPTRPY